MYNVIRMQLLPPGHLQALPHIESQSSAQPHERTFVKRMKGWTMMNTCLFEEIRDSELRALQTTMHQAQQPITTTTTVSALYSLAA